MMCICADVDADGSASDITGSPVVLCIIKAFSDGRVEFQPSMTSQSEATSAHPHRFVSPKGVAFEYELLNLAAPKPLDPAQQAKRDRDLRRMQDRVVGMRRSLVGSLFDEVSAQQDLRLHVFGEFVEGYVEGSSSAQLQLQLHKTSPTAHASSVAVASLHLLTPLFQVGL